LAILHNKERKANLLLRLYDIMSAEVTSCATGAFPSLF